MTQNMHTGSHISHGNLTEFQGLTCMNLEHFYITLSYKRREENYWLEYKGNGNNNFHNHAIRKVQTKIVAMTTKHTKAQRVYSCGENPLNNASAGKGFQFCTCIHLT